VERSSPQFFSRFLARLTLWVAVPIVVLGAFVFAVDPLWISPFDAGLARYYCVKSERQNKFDKAHFDSIVTDTILIGSSRANSFDFGMEGQRTFNFALGGIFPFEYQATIDFYAASRGEPKTVFLALDFYGSHVPTADTATDDPPQHFIDRIADPFYRLRNTLSWHVLAYAADTVTNCKPKPGGYGTFDRQGRMLVERLASPDEFVNRAAANLNFYGRSRYGASYVYNAEVETLLARLRDSHPRARFVVFITPESAPLWRLIVETGHFDDYARFLRQAVGVFGEVYDFLGYNSVSTDYANFYDGHHVYADVGRLVVRRVLGEPVPGHDDFGIKVTAANLAAHIARQRDNGPSDVTARQLLSMHPFPARSVSPQ
jgi:hypothetical protein